MRSSERDLLLKPAVQIAPRKTDRDWAATKKRLQAAPSRALWKKAFDAYFRKRIESRYLTPIHWIQKQRRDSGEGFAIVAIQCSLIEFLETARRGTNYRFQAAGEPPLTPFEYGERCSRELFTKFLTTQTPFAQSFDATLATDFYRNVRCAVLHEARTRAGWRIKARAGVEIVDKANKIVYRDGFQTALRTYLIVNEAEVIGSNSLQAAFIRKVDAMCD